MTFFDKTFQLFLIGGYVPSLWGAMILFSGLFGGFMGELVGIWAAEEEVKFISPRNK